MALKNTMNTQDAFTGQVPASWGKDMLLQDGSLASGWTGHVSEVQWTQDGD